jgi:UDP-N-acetylmuramyl pentapeptide phosphotransferase/UDP-N-acetylglucosamine-1-phosphate transferase
MLYVLALGMSALIVMALIPLITKLAIKIDFVDKPRADNERKIHRKPVPLMAGVALFLAFFATRAVFGGPLDGEFWAILAGSVLILGIGLVDDWYKTHGKDFPALPKFFVQVAAAFIVYRSGVVFSGFQSPFTHEYILLPIWMQCLLSVVWIFGVTTVINFSDGMDGLAGGLASISGATLFVAALAKGQMESAMMAAVLVGAALGYLRFNRYPAKVFMGDAGATFLGFILGIIALDGAFKQATTISIFIPVLALGVPIFDNLFVVIRRITHGQPAYIADASQVHFRLLSAGLTQKQVVAFLYLASVCLSLTSIILLLLRV